MRPREGLSAHLLCCSPRPSFKPYALLLLGESKCARFDGDSAVRYTLHTQNGPFEIGAANRTDSEQSFARLVEILALIVRVGRRCRLILERLVKTYFARVDGIVFAPLGH